LFGVSEVRNGDDLGRSKEMMRVSSTLVSENTVRFIETDDDEDGQMSVDLMTDLTDTRRWTNLKGRAVVTVRTS